MSYTKTVDELNNDELFELRQWSFEHLDFAKQDEIDFILNAIPSALDDSMQYLKFDKLEFNSYGGIDSIVLGFTNKFWDIFDNLPGNQYEYEMGLYENQIYITGDVEDFKDTFDNMTIILYGQNGEIDTSYSELVELLTTKTETMYSYEDVVTTIGEDNVDDFVKELQNLRNNTVQDFSNNADRIEELINELLDFDAGGDSYDEWLKGYLEGAKIEFDDNGNLEDVEEEY